MSIKRSIGLLCLACALGMILFIPLAFHAAPQNSGYRVLRTIQLGGEGGWDYVTVDPVGKRVYIPRGTHVMIVDEASGKLAGDIPDLIGLHGVAVAPEF